MKDCFLHIYFLYKSKRKGAKRSLLILMLASGSSLILHQFQQSSIKIHLFCKLKTIEISIVRCGKLCLKSIKLTVLLYQSTFNHIYLLIFHDLLLLKEWMIDNFFSLWNGNSKISTKQSRFLKRIKITFGSFRPSRTWVIRKVSMSLI